MRIATGWSFSSGLSPAGRVGYPSAGTARPKGVPQGPKRTAKRMEQDVVMTGASIRPCTILLEPAGGKDGHAGPSAAAMRRNRRLALSWHKTPPPASTDRCTPVLPTAGADEHPARQRDLGRGGRDAPAHRARGRGGSFGISPSFVRPMRRGVHPPFLSRLAAVRCALRCVLSIITRSGGPLRDQRTILPKKESHDDHHHYRL